MGLMLGGSFLQATEKTSCEKQWNDHYDNLPDSERDPNDSLIKLLLVEDCENDYKLMIERSRELTLSTAMDAYAVGDYVTAYKEFKMLAESGYAYAQFSLGMMHNNGEGVAQDYKEAMKWCRLAAEQGHTKAQHNIGWMYYIGEGVAQDYKEAMKWFRLAVEQGTEEAVRSQNNLGWMYDQGLGVIQDNVIAHMWYNIAVSSGDETAKNNKDSLAKKMTSEQIAEAQKLTDECIKNNYKDCS
jgi:TPR repeat protein